MKVRDGALVTVYPLEGARVRDPRSHQVVPKDGLAVTMSSFWRRRIAEGEIAVGSSEETPVDAALDVGKDGG